MSIKHIFQTSLVLLLALSMLLSLAACNKGDTTQTPTTTTDQQEAADPDEKQLAFPKTDFKAEFNVLYPEWQMYKDGYCFATEDQAGETIADAILERADLLYDYLGVDVMGIPTPLHGQTNPINAISIEVENKVAAGDDAYQMVLTHTYAGLAAMVTGGYLLDFYEMEHVNLEADYWNKNAVDTLAINEVGYFALSDYIIADPVVIFFNKEMLADYDQLEDPYQLVRDKQWTLDKMFEMASVVDYDNDGLSNPLDGTYGFTAHDDWKWLTLIDSCNVNLLDDYGDMVVLNMSAGNQRYTDLLTKVWQKTNEDWTYLFLHDTTSPLQMNISHGQALFSLESLKDAYKHRESEVKFGILTAPSWAEGEEYRNFNWSGVMCVPNTVENTEMVEKTLEALAFFSQSTLKPAYYEKLLGGRLADAPDDKEMLDVIWDSIVLNPIINYMETSGSDLGNLIYTISRGVRGVRTNGNSGIDIASRWNQYKNGAQDIIDKYLNGDLD